MKGLRGLNPEKPTPAQDMHPFVRMQDGDLQQGQTLTSRWGNGETVPTMSVGYAMAFSVAAVSHVPS